MNSEKVKSWEELSYYVLKELERLNKNYSDLTEKVEHIITQITILKMKAGFIGLFAGAIPSLIIVILYLVFKK